MTGGIGQDEQSQSPIEAGELTGNETIVSNVGTAKIRGVELDATGRITKELSLTATLGTLSSHFDNFLTQAPLNGVLTTFDYSENNLIYNPKFME